MAIQPVPDAPATVPFPGLNEKAAGTYNALAYAWGNQMPTYAVGIKALGDNVLNNANETKTNADIAVAKAGEGVAARDVAVAAAITALTAPGTLATSTTSMTIAQGEPAFVIEAGKNLRAGMFVTIGAPGGQVMYGRIQFYDNATGEIEVFVSYTEGAGTYSQWTVAVSGPPARIPRNKLFYYGGA
ncbi:hypothetical protein [Acidovorax sp. Root217]|uniref:hypothetical protein n=1 Tax=Acidovorax sp. Root217 TaxID=1736492 RepID=UPI00070BBABB|nr:hypothetical protein [Acidovorax sp. Root217]KRC30689.1 hypothetical protein ASE31_00455 [Acidovorax sp. Root217]